MSDSKQTLDPASTLIGVVGAGNMGAGIAQKYATEGFQVVVLDISEEAVARGQASIEKTLDEGVQRKIFKQEKRDQILSRLSFSTDRNALKDAALIVEAIFENKEVKQELFQSLDSICAKETILATNTSSFFVDDVAETTKNAERVLGLHYFYHPAKNKLVEVIKGSKSDDASFEKAWDIQEASGKIPVRCKDAPGFIVNRFFVPWLNESMRLVEEGIANIATVEAAAKDAFGVGMGPFELMNVTGVPITLHAATTLGEQLGPFYAPCDLIRPVVDAKENWSLEGDVDEGAFDTIKARLWGVTAQIACSLVFDEEVCTLEDCDLGARVGLRWPKGPFEAMNDLGTRTALQYVEVLAERYEDVKVPNELTRRGTENTPFDLRVVQTRVDDQGVGWLTIDRPDALNALSEDVMAQLGSGFDALLADDRVKGIVVEGRGKAFVAGADVHFFVDQIQKDNVPHIVNYASGGQDIYRKIDLSPKPVVCKLHGLSLGGGSELALACDYIVANERGSMGFPETGIGIYPGLGGTQRTARRIGIPLARWLVLSGDSVNSQKGLQLGLLDAVVPGAELDAKVTEYALSGKTAVEGSVPTNVPSGFEEIANLFSAPLADLKAGSVSVEGDFAISAAKMMKKIGFKAPLALEAADKLLQGAVDGSLADGLKRETAGLDAIFRSGDALEGMSALGKRRPNFSGK
jgi:enoyl-CoA hydratase / 3-hydroxyacyl-CoA dehydrogenase